MVPLSIYFHEGRAKVELALARGRRQYDKRHAIATRDASREAAREARAASRGGSHR
jgi:SsrA-binding protein